MNWINVIDKKPKCNKILKSDREFIDKCEFMGKLEYLYKSYLCLVEITDNDLIEHRLGIGIFYRYKYEKDNRDTDFTEPIYEYWEVSSFEDDRETAYNVNDPIKDCVDKLITRWMEAPTIKMS